jgi:hypothetical protein
MLLVYAVTMGVGGLLLFQVQPIMARFLLPWFGGSATTWTVCLLFFQTALLLGYVYAHVLTRPLTLRMQTVVQLAVLLLSLWMLPITPTDAWRPLDPARPVWRILALLMVHVGLPYTLLATTSPLLQRWLTVLQPALVPSRLFAVSNVGSFLGLLSYPFLVEPLFSTTQQTRLWSYAYGGYILLFLGCAWAVWRRDNVRGQIWPTSSPPLGTPPSLRTVCVWGLYAALGSGLLLATTNLLSSRVSVMPFLWVLPLSLYLGTFVLCFGAQHHYRRPTYGLAFAVGCVVMLAAWHPSVSLPFSLEMILPCLMLFVSCMVCHGELVLRFPAPPALTWFYLMLALGGALGGAAVTFLAPLVFPDYWEFWSGLMVLALLLLRTHYRDRSSPLAGGTPRWAWSLLTLTFVGMLGLLSYEAKASLNDVVAQHRNFYGVVKVVRVDAAIPTQFKLEMTQADYTEGEQFQVAAKHAIPSCDYDTPSGLGLAMRWHAKRRLPGASQPLRIGVVGLGAGMVATYGRAGDALRFYELNPTVIRFAQQYFTFLHDSPAQISIIPGDARLALEREAAEGHRQHFDIMVVDAFRGAAPPMHLMTQEAFTLYLRHLEPDGILAVGFDADYLDPSPLFRGLAAAFRLGVGWFQLEESDACEEPIGWAVFTHDADFWRLPSVQEARSPWPDDADTALLWSDQNSSLLSILQWK